MKRKGLEDREGEGRASHVRKAERRKKNPTFSIALLRLHCPAFHPILSLRFYWLAERLKQRDKELPTPSLGFKAIWGSFPSVAAWGHLAFVKGTRSEERLLSVRFNSYPGHIQEMPVNNTSRNSSRF